LIFVQTSSMYENTHLLLTFNTITMAKEKTNRENSKFTTGQLCGWESFLTVENNKLRNRKSKAITISRLYAQKEPTVQLDAILVFGDNLRAGAEAAEFLHSYKNKFDSYPETVCLSGPSVPHWIFFETSIPDWLKHIMVSLNIPDYVVSNYEFSSPKLDIACISELIEQKGWKKIGVFSSLGYSLPLAQQLLFYQPQVDWYFNDNLPIPLDERIFRSEIIGPQGYAIDLMLSNIVRLCPQEEDSKCQITDSLIAIHPELKLMHKMLERGYVLGLTKTTDWDYFALNAANELPRVLNRREDFACPLGSNTDIKPMVDKLISQFQAKQAEKLRQDSEYIKI